MEEHNQYQHYKSSWISPKRTADQSRKKITMLRNGRGKTIYKEGHSEYRQTKQWECLQNYRFGLISLPLPMVGIVLSVVPKSTAANWVDDNEEHEEYDVHDSDLLPVTLDVIQQASLAGLAVEAQNVGVIFPQITVGVGRVRSSLVPESWAHIIKIAVIWRLTATRLHISKQIRSRSTFNIWRTWSKS